jgi:basic amino acid/polyamine antiporter, APA family
MADTQVVHERESGERESSGLKRAVTPTMLLLFVVGDMVGGGIYALVGEVGGRVGGALWSGFALALLLALFTAGSYAELVTKYPKAGGAALYVHRAFGRPFVTFLLGFAVMMSSITSAAALSRAFGGDYLSEFVDLPVILTGLAIVGLIAAINFRGIGESVKVNVACTIIELLGLLLVVAIGVAFVSGGDGDPGRAFEFKEGSDSIPFLVLAGASLAFYALIGFEDSVNLAEETQETRRAYPRAIFGGIAIGGLIYVSVAIVASMAVPTDKLAESDGPLLEVVQLGPLAVDTKLFAAIALFSLANTILINLITASRLLYGMGEERVIPGVFRKVHAGRRTPIAAIIFSTGVAMALILTGDLESLADTTVTLLLIAFIGVNAAVLASRRDVVEHDHFHVPSAIPVIGVIVCAGLLTQREAEIWLRAGLLLLVGLVLWAVNVALTRREAQ